MKNAEKSIGLFLAPIVFVFLWSGGFAVAKVGIEYAEPMTLLVWRYILVVVLLVPFYFALKPPLPKRRMDWVHKAVVGVLVQGLHFGMFLVRFFAGHFDRGGSHHHVNATDSGGYSGPHTGQ